MTSRGAATPDTAGMTTPTPITSVTVCTKNHLDVGFTECEAKVLHDACRWMMPVAARQAAGMRRDKDAGEMVWTVPAFLAEYALEILRGDDLKVVEAGFAEGDLAWHALPFTTHTELLDADLLDAATAVSQRLDARFGKRTRCAKMTDVPGHTLGLVTALARAGVDFLHVGVNFMSAKPELPELFRWRDGLGNEIVVACHGSYGGTVQLPGDDRLLYWDMVGDNMEVPTVADCRARFAGLRAEYPGAVVRAGRADDWAGSDVKARAATLPVVTGEIGDSWIFGTGSDPWKTARFRALTRLRREWLQAKRLVPGARTLVAFDRQMLMVAEHTWGQAVAGSTHHDEVHWDNADFARIRRRGCWRSMEASWQEQRDHVDLAVAALEDAQLRAEAQAACDACAPVAADRATWDAIDLAKPFPIGGAQVHLDRRGAIVSLVAGGIERVAAGGALGLFHYKSYDDGDCRRFVAEYCKITGEFLLAEFTKSGLTRSSATSKRWDPSVVAAWRHGDTIAVDLVFAEAVVKNAGAPRRATATFAFSAHGVECRLTWWDKHPTRLPESLWWTFQPAVADAKGWRIDKSGTWIDPTDTVARGGRWLHAVQSGARNGAVRLVTRDAHLMAVGEPLLYAFPNRQIDPAGGLHLNLVNNLWGTNFPQYCGDDLAFRASLTWA